MEKKILFENENLKLEHAEEGNFLQATWIGYTSKEVFTKLVEKIIEYFNEFKSDGFLLDIREHKVLGPESQEFAAKKNGEYARTIGKLRQAIVAPEDVFAKFSVENYSKKIVDSVYPIETMYFDSIENAENWLMEGKG